MLSILGILLSYFTGAIPFGYLVTRAVAGKDIRTSGSGNIGATNVYRVLGIKWAVLVFALDCGKGTVAAYLFSLWFGAGNGHWYMLVCGVAAVIGHMYTVFLDFKGGKGVAVSVGVILGLGIRVPLLLLSLLISLLLWLLVFKKFRYVSLASLIASAAFLACTFALRLGKEFELFAGIVMIGILFSHRKNIGRLLQKKELKC